MDIRAYLNSQKEKIDGALRRYAEGSRDVPAELTASMRYSLEAGGKRVRPILVLAACEAVGGDTEVAMPVACAMELIHTFSLIHDDLPCMDNDDLRRGRPTNHKIYGDGPAVLAGDGMLSDAFSLMTHLDIVSRVDAKLLLDVIRDVATATGPCGMVGGQWLDLEAEGKSLTESEMERVHRFKTGALITASVTSGAKIGGARPDALEALREYGECVGLTFQIADDILNVEGNAAEQGKSVGSDIANNKSTYVTVLGLDGAKAKARALTDRALNALQLLDSAADPLRHLAEYIITRRA